MFTYKCYKWGNSGSRGKSRFVVNRAAVNWGLTVYRFRDKLTFLARVYWYTVKPRFTVVFREKENSAVNQGPR